MMQVMMSRLVVLLLSVVSVAASASTDGRHRVLLGDQAYPDYKLPSTQRAQAAATRAANGAVTAGALAFGAAAAAAQSSRDAIGALDNLRQQAGFKRRSLLSNGFRNPGTNLNTNTLRAQAATSQAILEAANSGGGSFATRRAGNVGSLLTFAASQNNDDVFDATDRAVTGRRLLRSLKEVPMVHETTDKQHATTQRHLLQFAGLNQNARATNNLRSQAATAQAIDAAASSGANRFSTRNAGRVGSNLAFAASLNNQQVFDVVERG